MKFRKKPMEIDAVKASEVLRFAATDWKLLPPWIDDAYECGHIVFASDSVVIKTLEGSMTANRGDWIIRGVKGKIYPCKPDIFAITYEAL